MIFYFSGTGNSRWVADELGKTLNERLVSIVEALKEKKEELSFPLSAAEKVVFVFPVHSWGPAVLVSRFISRLRLEEYKNQSVYFVCTCGDDCGNTDQIMCKLLRKRGIGLTDGFSIQMPNTYVLLPGFDVDKESVAAEKLGKAPERLREIADCILQQKKGELYFRGSFPALKSFTYPFFTHWVIGKNKFYATDACVSCGLCAEVCPTDTIALSASGKPAWKDTCVQCMACYHRCPTHAIEYGKVSLEKGHYHHPDLKRSIIL